MSQRNQTTSPEVSSLCQDGYSGHTDSLWISPPVTCILLRNYENVILIFHLWHWAVSPWEWNWITSLEELFPCHQSYRAPCLYVLPPKLLQPPELRRCPRDFLLPGQCDRGQRSVVSTGTEALHQEIEGKCADLRQ